MSLAHPDVKTMPQHLIVLVTALLVSMTPAFYSVSWKPWARYMLSGCIIVVLVLVVRVGSTWVSATM